MLVIYDWLKEYLGDDAPSAEKIEELLTFHSFEIEGVEEIGEHQVIDVDVLPNRSSDCLSHRGIAREIATLTGNTLVEDPLSGDVNLPMTDKLAVDITDTVACRRFGAALVTGIEVKESPDWLKSRLTAIGQRPINNVVDATNYVMFALGQPLHAYDAGKFPHTEGVWKFGVRFAEDGEKVTTLTGEEYELDSSVQLIVDGSNNTPAGIAGIKGGKYAEIDADTTSIILEAANFDPQITRKASQKLRLQTDASKRFENEPSRDLIPHVLRETVALILEIAGGECEGYVDTYPTPYANTEVDVTLERTNALLGLSLTVEEVEPILTRLGFSVTENASGFSVTAPFERTDINIEEDVIEEIGRVYGYEHVSSVVPEAVPLTELNARHYYSEKVRGVLLSEGFSEVITSSFRKKDSIRLKNALASDKECLRSSLVKNIAEVLDKNISHTDLLGIPDVRVFEIGTVFEKGEGTVKEHIALTLGVRQKHQGYTPKDDAILEEAIKKLEQALNSTIDRTIEKGVAEINFTKLFESLAAPTEYDMHEVGKEIQYKPFSQYPSMSRDIALWIGDDATADDVERVLNESAGDLRVRTTLFDEFTKDGKTSYAFRLVFQSYDRTLTDDEVNGVMDSVYKVAEEKGWEIR